MKSNPLGAIYSDSKNPEQKYATVILESICSLETTQNIFLKQSNPYINQTSLTNQFLSILNSVVSSQNPVPSMELINNLNNYALSHNQDLNNSNSPYTFLYFFLTLLEEEYNKAYQIQINLNQDFPSIDNAINCINQIYNAQNTSIILKNYFFSLLMMNKCNTCQFNKYKPVFKKTIDLNIDSYLKQNQGNHLSLNDCLQYYFTPKSIKCKQCQQSNSFQTRLILKSGPVLILNLMRENYTGTKDPNFTIDLNIDISNYKKDKSEGNNNYTLKSCISYSTFGFFTDCFVKRDNMEGAWYRYMDRQQIDSNPNILFEFQPVLLFYEICNNQSNINNMNVNVNQNINYNGQNVMQNVNIIQNMNINAQNNQMNQIQQIDENIEKKFDIISNFPLNFNIAIEDQFHNFDFNLNQNYINNQQNVQINNNDMNYQNQINNNFANAESQQQNQFYQLNQNNNFMNVNNNVNGQLNNFNMNMNGINQNQEQNKINNEQINSDSNERKDENVSHPFLNQNNYQNINSNMNNNDNDMNINNQNNINQPNQNNNLNYELNKQVIPGLDNLNINQNMSNKNNNLQNNNMEQNQQKNLNTNQKVEQNNININQFSQPNFMSGQINNQIQDNNPQNMKINVKEQINNQEQTNQIQPNIQQNNLMSNNNIIPKKMNKNINPQMPNMNVIPNQNKNLEINNSSPPQNIPNSNNVNQNKINNELPKQLIKPTNIPINQNKNNFNQIPKVNLPQNIPDNINKKKKEDPKPIKKEEPKPVPKNEEKKQLQDTVERKLSFQDKIKLAQGGFKVNPPQQQPAIKKRFSIEETSNKPQNNAAKKENKPISLGGNKFKEMQAMLAQRGVGFGAPRPSAQMMGMPHGFGNMNINKNDNKSNPSVEEREDLDKKLDKIVVQKNKKKKKKPNLDLDS